MNALTATAARADAPAGPALVRSEWRSGSLNVEQATPFIGAEISGVSLSAASHDADLVEEIRSLLLKHKVLFFRDQKLTPAQHVAFGRCFGDLEVNPFLDQHAEHPELVTLYKGEAKRGVENIFHSDVSWRARPSMGSILRCLECPKVGGDTIWVNMAMAYEQLPPTRRLELEGLRAVHDASHAFGGRGSVQDRQRIAQQAPPAEHPVVRVIPETGEKVLYVNQGFTTHFANFKSHPDFRSGGDNAMAAGLLMRYLFDQAAIPEYQVRLRWRPDTVAFWDNRSTQHYAVSDYYPAVRRMERATIVGEMPVG